MTRSQLLEQDIAATLAHVADATAIPALPTIPPGSASGQPTSRRWQRSALMGGIAFTVLAAGYGGAVASGVADAPSAFWGADNVKTDTATVLASYPGPDGTTVKVEAADASGDQRCVSFQVLPRTPHAPPNNGIGCGQWSTTPFGLDVTSNCCDRSPGGLSYQLFVRSAGPAETATLAQGGDTRSLVVRDGYVFGWAVADEAFTVTGYTASGSVVGHFTVAPPAPPSRQDLARLKHETPAAHIVHGQ